MTEERKTRTRGGKPFQRQSDGLWCVKVELPRDAQGNRRSKTVCRKDRAAVITERRRLLKELDRAGDLSTASPTVAAWLTLWLERIAAPRLKPRTLATYRGYVEQHIVPSIGRVRLDRLTTAHVRRVHDDIIGKGLSSTTALQAHRILAKALTDAEREGRVGRNVATLTDAPRRAVTTRGALTAEQARTLLLSVADNPYEAARWSVALLTGARQGECLGLTVDTVDLDAVDAAGNPSPMLHIQWQLQRLPWTHGCADEPCGRVAGWCPQRHAHIPAGQEARQVRGLWLTRPKSRAGWRQAPIAPLLHDVLDRYLTHVPPGDEGLIFHGPDGQPVNPTEDSKMWHAALERAGLPRVPLHSARHTCATLLYELGVPERTRVQIMGHSSAATTAGYTHVSDPLMVDAAGRLAALLSPSG